MWEPRRLTTLWDSTACYRPSFTLYLFWLYEVPLSEVIWHTIWTATRNIRIVLWPCQLQGIRPSEQSVCICYRWTSRPTSYGKSQKNSSVAMETRRNTRLSFWLLYGPWHGWAGSHSTKISITFIVASSRATPWRTLGPPSSQSKRGALRLVANFARQPSSQQQINQFPTYIQYCKRDPLLYYAPQTWGPP
jgi:hypothetical protein